MTLPIIVFLIVTGLFTGYTVSLLFERIERLPKPRQRGAAIKAQQGQESQSQD